MASVLMGTMPWGWAWSSATGAPGWLAVALIVGCPDAEAAPDACEPSDTAISPGRITRNGKNILGMVAISGTLRADSSESAAMARWTTRKFVHQYPKLRTKPRPIVMPTHSTPSELVLA